MQVRKFAIVLLSVAMVVTSIIGYHMKETQPQQDSEISDVVVDGYEGDSSFSVGEESLITGEDLVVDLLNNKIEEDKKENNYEANTDSVLNENGGLDIPFDEAYPEVFEKGNVAYSKDTLLIKFAKSFNGALNASLKDAGVSKIEKMFDTNDATWYEAYVTEGTDVKTTMASVRGLDDVVLAEYNFVYETAVTEVEDWDHHHEGNKEYHKQWHRKHCDIEKAWQLGKDDYNLPGGSSSVVVAVIDTGVDYNHIDLAANMWKNPGEIEGNGRDDDGNGYVDDVYGVDITAGRNSGMDDQGHGTHVAGIIAAVNNKEGILGLAYNTKIMAVKAGDSSGYFLQSNIAKAVLYAYQNGADVINMSFGGTACSIAVQDALATAYTSCVLVASAGNDGAQNEAINPGLPVIPNYPAALSYVLGVMSVGSSNVESSFTNYDAYLYNAVEYEVYAPGEQILSTIPGDKYAVMSGTSMAAPVVAAQAALLRSYYLDRDTYPTKFIYGQIVGTAENKVRCINPSAHLDHNIPGVVNFYKSMTELPVPDIGMSDYTIFDTAGFSQDTTGTNNGDGILDAGETVALGFTLRNRWGMSTDTVVSVTAESENGVESPYIEVLNNNISYGSIGTYSETDSGKLIVDDYWEGWVNPFYLRISKNTPNDYSVALQVKITYKNGLNKNDKTTYETTEEINLMIRRGVVVPYMINEDTTLTKDNYYIIPTAVTVAEGATLTIEPGTKIQFWTNDPADSYAESGIAYMRVQGTLNALGTEEEPIEMFPSEWLGNYRVEISGGGNVNLKHTKITNPYIEATTIENCEFVQNFKDKLNYKEYYNGTISTRYYGGKVYADTIKGSAFYRLGGESTSSNHIFNLKATELLENIFVDSSIHFNFTNGIQENNVFYGNNNEIIAPTTTDTPSSMEGIQYHVSNDIKIMDYFTLPETDNTYLTIAAATSYSSNYPDNVYPSGVLSLSVIKRFMNSIDAGWVSFGDMAEFEGVTRELTSYADYKGFSSTETLVYRIGATEVNNEYFNHDGTYLPSDAVSETKQDSGEIFLTYRKNRTNIYTLEQHTYIGTNNDGVYDIYHGDADIVEIPSIYPSRIELPEYLTCIKVGNTYSIRANTYPKDKEVNLVYESDNPKVATVDQNGVVKGIAAGTTTIKVYSEDKGIYNYLTVNVSAEVKLQSIGFVEPTMYLKPYDTQQINALFYPSNATQRNVTYTSSDESIASVDVYGNVYAYQPGEVTMTVKEANGIKGVLNVYVAQPGTSLAFEESTYYTNLTVDDGDIAIPNTDTNIKYLTWETTNPEVCYVDGDGKLVKVSEGSASIRVTDNTSGLYDEMFVVIGDSIEPFFDLKKATADTYLLENGDLWYTDADGMTQQAPVENVKDFVVSTSNYEYVHMYLLFEDGSVYGFRTDTLALTEQPVLEDVAMLSDMNYCLIGYSQNRTPFAVKNDGALWALDSYPFNKSGAALEEIDLSDAPMKDIVKMVRINTHLYILDSNHDLYVAGASSYLPGSFTLQDVGVIDIYAIATSTIGVEKENSLYTIYSGDEFSSKKDRVNDTDVIIAPYSTTSYAFSIQDGNVYRHDLGEPTFDKRDDATELHGGLGLDDDLRYKVYVETADHKVYKGDERFCLGVGATLVELSYDENNLNENILNDDTLELTFSSVVSAGNGFDSIKITDDQGVNVPFEARVEFNRLVIEFTEDLVVGDIYTVTVPKMVVENTSGFYNTDINFEFEAGEIEISDLTHDQVVNEEIVASRDMVTEEEIMAFWSNFVDDGYNTRFYSNVILNRLNDDDVTSWLRVFATEVSKYKTVSLGGNYWGTTNEKLINEQIMDYEDYSALADINHGAFLTEAPENTYPFVVSAYLEVDGEQVDTVGNELVTFVVEFNRDMDTSIDLDVRFGSAYPYADYQVEGSYESARVWKGQMQLTTIIENGYQYWSVSNGKAAGTTYKLFTDWGRFPFMIDTSSAQALLMQAEVNAEGIQLTWSQDEYETLAGYNVYRSTEEDGFYTKINRTMIPADTKEWFDDTVEPGVTYYYNFTVVDTDLVESEPSGKVVITALDTMAPNIYHSPVYDAFTGNNLIISASVTDNVAITSAKVYYRVVGTTTYRSTEMTNYNDKYRALIPAEYMTTAGLEYYIEATDGISKTYKGSASEPFVVNVNVAVSDNQKGDVDGNGQITLQDAMKLLYAINDKYNMTAEEFARADIDGDGKLEAVEALMIIQYVNGTITTIPVGN